MRTSTRKGAEPALVKCPTGVSGLDEVTRGGLPRGRPTLVCGGPGSGKTLLAMEFLVRGAREFGEPGVFMAFEETEGELAANVASLGFDLPALIRRKQLLLDYVQIERAEIEETGEYDLEGLFVRLNSAITAVGAKRVALDSLEALFAGLPNEAIVRAELRRLFRWLKTRELTAVITAEQGERTLTRHGLEEYVSDCVIFLDHRVNEQVATRRLRVVKYRGSAHGTNEYPTLIDEHGLSVLPISSLDLRYPVSSERVSSGIPALDDMLGGDGYYKGSTVLVSGTSGAGKSSVATAFANSVCEGGGRCLYWASEEAPDQIMRNMGAIGFRLPRHVRDGLLHFHAVRPTLYGLETHLVTLHKLVREVRPEAVIIDPVTNLSAVGNEAAITSMLTRVVDFLKTQNITTLVTSLTSAGDMLEGSGVAISSLMDTWLLLRMVESARQRKRVLYVLKSRGMAHSNEMRGFTLTSHGIQVDGAHSASPGATGAAKTRAGASGRRRAAPKRARRAVRSMD